MTDEEEQVEENSDGDDEQTEKRVVKGGHPEAIAAQQSGTKSKRPQRSKPDLTNAQRDEAIMNMMQQTQILNFRLQQIGQQLQSLSSIILNHLYSDHEKQPDDMMDLLDVEIPEEYHEELTKLQQELEQQAQEEAELEQEESEEQEQLEEDQEESGE